MAKPTRKDSKYFIPVSRLGVQNDLWWSIGEGEIWLENPAGTCHGILADGTPVSFPSSQVQQIAAAGVFNGQPVNVLRAPTSLADVLDTAKTFINDAANAGTWTTGADSQEEEFKAILKALVNNTPQIYERLADMWEEAVRTIPAATPPADLAAKRMEKLVGVLDTSVTPNVYNGGIMNQLWQETVENNNVAYDNRIAQTRVYFAGVDMLRQPTLVDAATRNIYNSLLNIEAANITNTTAQDEIKAVQEDLEYLNELDGLTSLAALNNLVNNSNLPAEEAEAFATWSVKPENTGAATRYGEIKAELDALLAHLQATTPLAAAVSDTSADYAERLARNNIVANLLEGLRVNNNAEVRDIDYDTAITRLMQEYAKESRTIIQHAAVAEGNRGLIRNRDTVGLNHAGGPIRNIAQFRADVAYRTTACQAAAASFFPTVTPTRDATKVADTMFTAQVLAASGLRSAGSVNAKLDYIADFIIGFGNDQATQAAAIAGVGTHIAPPCYKYKTPSKYFFKYIAKYSAMAAANTKPVDRSQLNGFVQPWSINQGYDEAQKALFAHRTQMTQVVTNTFDATPYKTMLQNVQAAAALVTPYVAGTPAEANVISQNGNITLAIGSITGATDDLAARGIVVPGLVDGATIAAAAIAKAKADIAVGDMGATGGIFKKISEALGTMETAAGATTAAQKTALRTSNPKYDSLRIFMDDPAGPYQTAVNAIAAAEATYAPIAATPGMPVSNEIECKAKADAIVKAITEALKVKVVDLDNAINAILNPVSAKYIAALQIVQTAATTYMGTLPATATATKLAITTASGIVDSKIIAMGSIADENLCKQQTEIGLGLDGGEKIASAAYEKAKADIAVGDMGATGGIFKKISEALGTMETAAGATTAAQKTALRTSNPKYDSLRIFMDDPAGPYQTAVNAIAAAETAYNAAKAITIIDSVAKAEEKANKIKEALEAAAKVKTEDLNNQIDGILNPPTIDITKYDAIFAIAQDAVDRVGSLAAGTTFAAAVAGAKNEFDLARMEIATAPIMTDALAMSEVKKGFGINGGTGIAVTAVDLVEQRLDKIKKDVADAIADPATDPLALTALKAINFGPADAQLATAKGIAIPAVVDADLGKATAEAVKRKIEAAEAVKVGDLQLVVANAMALVTPKKPTFTAASMDAYKALIAELETSMVNFGIIKGGVYEHVDSSKADTGIGSAPFALTEARAIIAQAEADEKAGKAVDYSSVVDALKKLKLENHIKHVVRSAAADPKNNVAGNATAAKKVALAQVILESGDDSVTVRAKIEQLVAAFGLKGQKAKDAVDAAMAEIDASVKVSKGGQYNKTDIAKYNKKKLAEISTANEGKA